MIEVLKIILELIRFSELDFPDLFENRQEIWFTYKRVTYRMKLEIVEDRSK